MVTHDRYFLDSVTNRIVELDKGKLYSYQANYEGYLELKAQRLDMEQATERKRQSLLRVELEWMQRGARARSTKQKAHIERFETLIDQKGPEADQNVELLRFQPAGPHDSGAGGHQQGLWRQGSDEGFHLYFPEK